MNVRTHTAAALPAWLAALAAAVLLLGGCTAPSRPATHDAAPAAAPVAVSEAQATPAAPPGAVQEQAPASAQVTAGAAAPAAVEVVRQAYREITGQLFREIAPSDLLRPAWSAVFTEARRGGVSADDLGPYEARGSGDIDAFSTELTAFLLGPGQRLDNGRIGQVAVRAMAAAVGDSHTRFLTPEQADSQRRAADGDTSYSGIGVRLDPTGGAFVISEVFSNSPADRAGLRAGDHILGVNGRETAALRLDELSGQVRGPEGTEVRLTIQRSGEGTRDVTVNRARIAEPLVTARMLDAGLGYIRITSFPRRSAAVDAARDFDDQLHRLVDQGARGLVFDLRGNPGGDPFTSVAVASSFVPDGPIFVAVNRDGRRTTYPATTRATVFHGPVAVLVDRGTASGAEVVASALQEYGAGLLIGSRSCGCLSVGKPLQLGDSSGLIVTVEQALTGRLERSLEGVGLTPDQLTTTNAPSDRADPQRDRAVTYLRSQLP